MRADRKWVERNLGFDPIAKPPPLDTFNVKRVARATVKRAVAPAKPEDFQREIIDFDFRVARGPTVHGLQHGDRAVAIYRHSMAQEISAPNGFQA